ncbi:MAG TPA: hypothetical protein VF755_02185 [Catenuloplanes sp.]|jgi:hypothetical protein
MVSVHYPADEAVLAEALFTSHLQASDTTVPAETVREVVAAHLARHGPDGCAGLVAYEFGEHPYCAVRRMAWARRTVRATFGPPALQSA